MEYQQFVANVEEEEAWINEKMTLVASEDYGDTLAAIQVRGAGAAACRFVQWPRSGRESSRPAATVSLVRFSPPDLLLETLPLWTDLSRPPALAPRAPWSVRRLRFHELLVPVGPLGPSARGVQQQEAMGL